MASLIFAQAKMIRRKAKADREVRIKQGESLGLDEETIESNGLSAYQNRIDMEINEFREILSIAKQLHEVYVDTTGLVTKNWYFVTIRPDEKKIDFDKFRNLVFKKLESVRVLSYKLSFEQKGTSIETIGTGFHAHFVLESTWRSKAEVLRDVFSLFQNYLVKECIQVSPTRNPDRIVEEYLIKYESKDDHKKETKDWDALWRKANRIEPLYTSSKSDAVIKSVTASNIG